MASGSMTSDVCRIGLQCACISCGDQANVVTTCMFCEASLSVATKLLHGRYCSSEHKEAYFKSMDELGLERLIAARPRMKSYEPCTKPLALAPQSPEQPVHSQTEPRTPSFTARMRPHLELPQGQAAVVAGL